MAKYNVLFSCGHEEIIELLGPGEERKRKIEYFRECGLCSECYKKKKQMEQKGTKSPITMHYADYKKQDLIYEAIKGTYNHSDKTIEVVLKDLYLLTNEGVSIQCAVDSKKDATIIINNKVSSNDIVSEDDYFDAYPILKEKTTQEVNNFKKNIHALRYSFKDLFGKLVQNNMLVKCQNIEEFKRK